MLAKSLAALALLAADVSATIYYAGVAESSGEFGVWSATATPGTGLPGRFGVDYQFISKPGIDTYITQNKVNLFRIAFLLERMCPPATGLGSKFNETHFDLFKESVEYITNKGAYVILDPHNYMRYNDPSSQPFSGSVIGNSSDPKAATTAQFGQFWAELGGRFKNNNKVIFGLMNEPHDMQTSLVLANNQAAINGIRRTGAANLIIAPGNAWTGAHAWTTGYTGYDANSDYMYKLVDPLNNTGFDVHQYLDKDSSGGPLECTRHAAENLDPLTAWLKKYKFKAFVTEFGAANGTQCKPYLEEFVTYLNTHEEYIGWTAWAAGPFWGPYSPCCTNSAQWGSLEPGSVASDGSPGLYTTVWQATIQALVPKRLQWKGPASVKGGVLSSALARS
ncbi:endoglucanase 1 [Bisporella sp. PMI_857]|nr:endoglucanase 1 [Bisporella sp. PMI_857]